MISFSRFTIGKNWINICVLFYKLMTDNIYPKLQIFSFRAFIYKKYQMFKVTKKYGVFSDLE